MGVWWSQRGSGDSAPNFPPGGIVWSTSKQSLSYLQHSSQSSLSMEKQQCWWARQGNGNIPSEETIKTPGSDCVTFFQRKNACVAPHHCMVAAEWIPSLIGCFRQFRHSYPKTTMSTSTYHLLFEQIFAWAMPSNMESSLSDECADQLKDTLDGRCAMMLRNMDILELRK